MRIVIDAIPYEKMRYPTLGDYQFKDGELHISVAQTGLASHNLLLAIHELVEFAICREHGITCEAIDKFDKAHPELDDPGEDPRCPYHSAHSTALGIERIVAAANGIKWQLYEENLEATKGLKL